jgi:hypothetical protein
MDLTETGRGNVERVDLPQDGDQWRAFVNMVMNLHIP